MTINEKYMARCLQLAKRGLGQTKLNPLVGAVIVHEGRIIGEGFHKKFGGKHAEVNAVDSVKDKSLLSKSTIYVSLEPCSHYGKTPPCTQLIVNHKIPKVVVAVLDPNPVVSGRGVNFLRDNGVDVSIGMLEDEARELNRVFFVNQIYKRPYVTLKWAESSDGFIDIIREDNRISPTKLSNSITQCLSHKLRTENSGIMVGTNTALKDNPQLTARKWFGDNPVRVVIDRENKIPHSFSIFNDQSKTIVFTKNVSEINAYPHDNVIVKQIDFSGNTNNQILSCLYEEYINSLIIEGGAQLLTSFIEKKMWDEAFVEISDKKLITGIKSPAIEGEKQEVKSYSDSIRIHLKNKITRNFL